MAPKIFLLFSHKSIRTEISKGIVFDTDFFSWLDVPSGVEDLNAGDIVVDFVGIGMAGMIHSLVIRRQE